MDLSRISINARLRSPWEAVDLGVVMARTWWRPMFLSWFVPAAVIFLLCTLLLPQHNWVGYTVVWWLKPILDRGPLFIASRRLFGEDAGALDVWRNLRSLYGREWFLWLTLRRFVPTRSFDMPLTVLEQLKGKQRSNRQTILQRSHAGPAGWLTIVGIHVEGFLVLGVAGFLVLMIPEQVHIDYLSLIVDQESAIGWVYNTCFFFAMTVVGPFYAAMGFALYISRRIELEAWDVEIRFRHMAAEYTQSKSNQSKNNLIKNTLGMVLGCLLLGAAVTPEPARAMTPLLAATEAYESEADLPPLEAFTDDEDSGVDEEEIGAGGELQAAKDSIVGILEGYQFHRTEEVSGWRLKDLAKQDPQEIPEWLIALLAFLVKHADIFAGLAKVLRSPLEHLEVILWALVIALVLVLIYRYRKNIRNFIRSHREPDIQPAKPDVLFGLDVTRDSLPEDVPAEVRALWQQGEHRGAVSLLYRALLAGLIHDYNFIFSDSYTEGECVRVVKTRGDRSLSDYTVSLTQVWQRLAYGHRVPASEEIEGLCLGWYKVFPHD